MRDRPKVGEILVQAGIIDEHQLASALGEQARWGRRLGMTLIKLGMVQEGHLVRALAKQFDLPVASLAGKKIAPEVLALVPAKVACEHSVVPLFVKKEGPKGQLFLGMEEPSDLSVLDDLAFRTGMMIRPVMVGPTEIGEAIDRYYMTRPAPPVAPAASKAPVLPDPERTADTLSENNLRRVREDVAPARSKPTPVPAPVELLATPVLAAAPVAHTAPVAPAAEAVFEAIEEITAPVAPAPAPPPISVPAPVLAPLPSTSVSETSPPAASRDAIPSELARAVEETERTRLVAKAIAHLLIEKGILTLDELQARIEKMRTKPPGSGV